MLLQNCSIFHKTQPTSTKTQPICAKLLQSVAKILSRLFAALQYYICNNREVGDFGTKSN